MEERHDRLHCEGRRRREGACFAPFCDVGAMLRARWDSSAQADQPQPPAVREVTMTVVRDGYLWEAKADLPIAGEGTFEWMAVAICAFGISVDLAREAMEGS